jgi:hypothetical protein
VIEPTDEMVHAFMRGYADADDGSPEVILNWTAERAGLAAVLAIVARDHVILPRGAQALCCGEHPEVPVRWGECPVCVASMPPEERT